METNFIIDCKDKVGIIVIAAAVPQGPPFRHISVIQRRHALFYQYEHLYEIPRYWTHITRKRLVQCTKIRKSGQLGGKNSDQQAIKTNQNYQKTHRCTTSDPNQEASYRLRLAKVISAAAITRNCNPCMDVFF